MIFKILSFVVLFVFILGCGGKATTKRPIEDDKNVTD